MYPDRQKKHQQELENLTLATQPFRTTKFFVFGVAQYLKRSILYLLAKGGWLMLISTVIGALGILLMTLDGRPHEKVFIETCISMMGIDVLMFLFGKFDFSFATFNYFVCLYIFMY